MTALSKILTQLDCADVAHSGKCTVNAVYQLPRFFISNARYYAPLMLPALAKFGNLNRAEMEKTLRYYIGNVLIGTSEGWIAAVFLCIFKYLRGHFSYYTLIFLPGFMGGLSILFAPRRVRNLHLLTIFQCTVESILIRRKNILTRTIADSKLVQTLLFMSSSSIILHAKRIGAYRGFWLLTPDDEKPVLCESDEGEINMEVIPDQEEIKKCTHKEKSCMIHLLKGIRSYFVFGITLDFLKALISSVPKSTVGFFKIFLAKLRTIKLNSTALLASYIGIYRLTHCYLNRSRNGNPTVNHLAAGFLSGVCYIFMPKLTWLGYALVISVQILWNFFKAQLKDEAERNPFWRTLKNMSFGNILFPICVGHLIHAYCWNSDKTSNFAQIVIDNTTNFYAGRLYKSLNTLDKFLKAEQ